MTKRRMWDVWTALLVALLLVGLALVVYALLAGGGGRRAGAGVSGGRS